jgi:hypothetical protein
MAIRNKITNMFTNNSLNKENFREFLEFLDSEKIPVDYLCHKFYEINKGWLDLDMREKRSIGDIKQIKKQCQIEYLRNKSKIESLGENLNIGIDIETYEKRLINENEHIITIFESGKTIKGQEHGGYHLIIPKSKTLCFNINTQCIEFINPIDAEILDDKIPMENTLIDSSSCKHSCRYVYSKRLHNEFYNYLVMKIAQTKT